MPAMAEPAHVPPTLISLRPAGQHEPLRRAARRQGMGLLAVSPWRLQPRDDEASRAALATALRAPVVVFTSPAAVRAAAALRPLPARQSAQWLAVGEGTARALRRAGVQAVAHPGRMDSEGLLALPALATATRVGLVTAPGGRGLVAATLASRGCELLRADVYERRPLPIAAHTLARLRGLGGRSVLAISSAEAFERTLAQLPGELLARWRQRPVVVASARLAALVREHGFAHVLQADGPRPGQLATAAARALA